MQPRKPLQVLIAGLAVPALLSLPAAASAAPQWRLNGVLAGPTKQGVSQFGTLTLTNAILGEFKCKIIAGASVRNESGKGLYAVEAWEAGTPFGSPAILGVIETGSSSVCSYTGNLPGCKEGAEVTAESVELIEETEKHYTPKRRLRTFPWPGELFETTEKTTSLNLHKIKIFLDCPREGLEIPYEGNLEPKVMNGAKNGMSPSKLVFEGNFGNPPIWLGTCSFGVPCESEEHNLYVSGELTLLGTTEQLVTAR
jgi:hypothetical protein